MPNDTHAAPSGPATKLEPNMQIWIVFGDRVKFGHGRVQWWQTIDELGSLRKRVFSPERVTLLPGLLEQAAERTPLPNGFRWRFITSGECLAAVVETINTERGCCRFLRFVVTIEPDDGPLWLEITGPPGTTEFLETLLCA